MKKHVSLMDVLSVSTYIHNSYEKGNIGKFSSVLGNDEEKI